MRAPQLSSVTLAVARVRLGPSLHLQYSPTSLLHLGHMSFQCTEPVRDGSHRLLRSSLTFAAAEDGQAEGVLLVRAEGPHQGGVSAAAA